MPFRIVRNDITKMSVDAIVNPANRDPVFARGTDSAVYTAAGCRELLEQRRKIGVIEYGDAAITDAFALDAKYIIHTAAPRYIDGSSGEAETLRACYEKCLALALENNCESIAFPLLSTGNFGYPKEEGLEIVLGAVHSFLMKEEMDVYLVVFDDESVHLSGRIFDDIEAYIDENYVIEKYEQEYTASYFLCDSMPEPEPEPAYEPDFDYAPIVSRPKNKRFSAESVALPPAESKMSLDDMISNIGETFQQRLFRLIDERGRDDVDVYKGAGKDKKLFHKIKSNINYQPSKHTVFAFAISLRLSLGETKELLRSAGFALSPSSRFDIIMQYIFEQGIYDMYKIDCILFDCGEEHYFCCE
ncbi:MAG: hypothetical protein E7546_05020 [Ruminococcaceae bacterium]|nr:hypothetical protein [Oscillospiraceae bacterium]